jgi:hypothetical protein
MGATHFLTKTLPKVSTEMTLHVLAYNIKRAVSISYIRAISCNRSRSHTASAEPRLPVHVLHCSTSKPGTEATSFTLFVTSPLARWLEPASLSIFGFGLAGLIFSLRSRRRG